MDFDCCIILSFTLDLLNLKVGVKYSDNCEKVYIYVEPPDLFLLKHDTVSASG